MPNTSHSPSHSAKRPFARRSLPWVLLAMAFVSWLGAGCSGSGQPASSSPAPAAGAGEPKQVIPEATVPQVAIAQQPAATASGPAVVTLTWWTPPNLSLQAEGAAGSLMSDHLAAFEQANPLLAVDPVLKGARDKGGLLDLLLTAQAAAPGILPDLVSLNSDELPTALRAGLLQPLDDLLPASLLEDLYPFARDIGRQDGQTYAVHVEADIVHLAFNGVLVPDPPGDWAAVLDGTHTYAFSIGQEGNPGNAFLIQYRGAGGSFGSLNAPFVLDQNALFKVLDFYARGRASGLIPAPGPGLESMEGVWLLLRDRQVDMAHVMASRYLAERARNPNLAFGPVPTADGEPVTVSEGWTLAIVTTDQERKVAAARFVAAMLDATFNSAWAQTAGRLPVRRSALAQWNQSDPYVPFLDTQLEAAIIRPAGTGYLEIARVLAQAQQDVLNGSADARSATDRATGSDGS